MGDTKRFDFVKYRPARISDRLPPNHLPENRNWAPSVSYKFTLDDIKNQFTPAEYFRHRLATSGFHIRLIQKLELRWSRNLGAFIKAAIKLQSLYRGVQGRRHFERVSVKLKEELKERRIFQSAVSCFKLSKFEDSLRFIDEFGKFNEELAVIRMKSFYRLISYHSCIKAANETIGK